MPLHEAWSILGKDINVIMNGISKLPRSERSGAVSDLSKEAKKLSRALLAKNHPDMGGDAEKFQKVQNALEAIFHHAEMFEKKTMEAARKAEESMARRSVFIEKK